MPRKMIVGPGGSTIFPDVPECDIVSLSPTTGAQAGGTTVRVNVLFARPDAAISIDGDPVTIDAASYGVNGWFEFDTPAGTGAVDVVVTDGYGTSAPAVFTYTGTALTAGTASGSAGDTQVFLTATAASGGTSPYTYQWYFSTDGSKGSAIVGATTLSYTHTGRTNDTEYDYTLEATDSAAASVDYTLFSVTPVAAGPTNEPGGMTQLIYTDGSNRLFTSAVGTVSYGARWTNDTYVEVIDDAQNPGGSGKAIEKRTFIGDGDGWNGTCSVTNWASPYTGGVSEIYIRLRAKFSSNWQNHPDNAQKIIMFGGSYASSQDFVFMAWGTATGVSIRMTPQVSSNAGVDGQQSDFRNSGAIVHGNWFTSELWMKAQTAPGASDGEIKMWLNDSLTVNLTGQQWWGAGATVAQATKFETFKGFLYWGGQGGTKTVDDYVRIGELYISGKL